jgi:putative flippase GtrA
MTGAIAAQAMRFLLAGIANTLATYALYLALLVWLDYDLSYTVCFVIGIALSYWLNARFVFRVAPNWRTFAAFPLVYLVQYLAGALVLNLAVRAFGVPREYALLASIVVNVPLTFLLSRSVLLRAVTRVHGVSRE